MPPESDARSRLQKQRRQPSVTDSLQSLHDAGGASASKPARQTAWRDSVSGLARNILLRAKDSIDTLRGASDGHSNASSTPDPDEPPHRSFSSETSSLRSVRYRDKDEPAITRHASLSLRRVLTSSSKGTKRSPLLVTLMSKRSMSKLQGPEELMDEAATSPFDTSPGRTSLKKLSKRLSSHSRTSLSSMNSSREDTKSPTPRSSPVRASSPIPIPRLSPPPMIDLQIETGRLSPEQLFIVEESPQTARRAAAAVPKLDVATRDSMIINSRRTRRPVYAAEPRQLPVPRRTSNDHWRLRRAARNRSARFPSITKQSGSGMEDRSSAAVPVTGDSVNDPFDEPVSRTLQGSTDLAAEQARPTGALCSPSAGHIDAVTGLWVSDDPVAKAIPASSPTEPSPTLLLKEGLGNLQRTWKDVLTRQVLLECTPDVLSPSSLKAELQAGREALERLEQRIGGIEAQLQGQSNENDTPTPSPKRIISHISDHAASTYSPLLSPPLSPPPSLPSSRKISRQLLLSSPTDSRNASSNFSCSSVQSPLETQDLFYAPESEMWNLYTARRTTAATSENASPVESGSIASASGIAGIIASPATPAEGLSPIAESSERGSASKGYDYISMVRLLRDIESPTMGSHDDFIRQRDERATRYYNIFHTSENTSVLPSRSPTPHDDVAGMALSLRTPEMLSWAAPEDTSPHTVISPLLVNGSSSPPPESPKHERTTPLEEPGTDDDLTPTQRRRLETDLLHSLGWQPGSPARKSPHMATAGHRVPFRARQGAAWAAPSPEVKHREQSEDSENSGVIL